LSCTSTRNNPSGSINGIRIQRSINYKESFKYSQGLETQSMILSIPLFSAPLLAAAALMAIGLLLYPVSARLAVAGIGAGSVIMGIVVLAGLPEGFEMQAAVLFGIAVVVGGWMVFIAARNG